MKAEVFSNFGPFEDIHEKIVNGERLTFEDGLRLYQSNHLCLLGRLAQMVRLRRHGRKVFYSVNLHLNHTNVCSLRCLFCAFARRPGEKGGYTLSLAEIREKVRTACRRYGINEVHIVGGHNPDLDLDYYLEMFRLIRAEAPGIYIKALTAPEIHDIAMRSGRSWREVLEQFRAAGLDGLPGGGAEIFAPAVRKKICREKLSSEEWLEIHRTAHELGLRTNATMLYGHIETAEDRVDHVLKLRALQDRTRGFCSFIPLAYNSEYTPMEKIREAGGFLDLKVLAVSRLLFDNVPHIKAHWSAIGLKMGQVALSFGADDFGGTNLNEKIMRDAGSGSPVDLGREELQHVIVSAGYEPCCVDSSYELVS